MTDCPRREWVLMDTDVLVAGAGPIGLSTAIELRRRGISCRIVDPLDEPRQYAKAVGIQPRTLELFENMGVLRQALDASTLMRGQIMYTNGVEVGRVDLTLPEDVPYWFLCLPQYSTERILTERLTELGTTVERGVGLTAFEQSDDAVTCTLSDGSTVTARYLVGSDGAHSVVRKGLGLSFEGGAFAESYMLGDVEVDWSIPSGYSVRANHTADDGTTDDLLVCIPLPGHKRYRMSMLVPDELMPDESSNKAAVQHGFFNRQDTGTPSHPGCARQTVHQNRQPPRCCDGPRSSASATASSTLTAADGFLSPATPRTSIPRLARRA